MKQPFIFSRFTAWLGRPVAFRVILGLLVIQAGWLALSGRYPMAFDEDFHLGIIKLYAHHPLPFWSGQPAGADMFGAVARDPSYLYHYLMSFPYRLVSALTDSLFAQVIVLRAISIGLFTAGLVLWRRLLLKTSASAAMVHACLAIFCLISAVPLLAAQINYDNLLLPVVAGLLLLVVRVQASLRRDQPFAIASLLLVISICMLASLIKYAFLPIAIAIAVYLLVCAVRNYSSWGTFGRAVQTSWRALSGYVQVALLVGLLLSAGLFVERYGLNMLRYHTPVPDCGKVLTVKQCSAYGPWIRDYNFEANNVATGITPLSYIDDWLYGMWLRLFFAVDGPSTLFQTRGPLTVPGISAIVFAAISVVLLAWQWKSVFTAYRRSVLWLFVACAGCYIAVLWLDGYQRFAETGQPVAINGRYLLPVLLPLLLLAAMAWSQALRSRSQLKIVVCSAALACLLYGGGALTYIIRSNDAWYWPQAVTTSANHGLQRILRPVVLGSGRPTQFLR